MTESAAQTIELPEPNGTTVMRAITNRILDEGKGGLAWAVGSANPLVKDMKIIRMYSSAPEAPEDEDGKPTAQIDTRRELRVYSLSTNKIIRHIIPPDQIRLIEEALTLEAFLEEIDAEEGIEEDEEPEEGGPSPGEPSPQDNPLS